MLDDIRTLLIIVKDFKHEVFILGYDILVRKLFNFQKILICLVDVSNLMDGVLI